MQDVAQDWDEVLDMGCRVWNWDVGCRNRIRDRRYRMGLWEAPQPVQGPSPSTRGHCAPPTPHSDPRGPGPPRSAAGWGLNRAGG